MLQQILRDMWVDPEILAGLDEEQKQTLFCRMREEQVRRWKIWDEQDGDKRENEMKKKTDKSVSFLKGDDGEPWVWIMGEHENDISIDEILKEEAIQKACQLAEQEAEELRKTMEAQLSDYIQLTPKIEDLQLEINRSDIDVDNKLDIYCSVDELRESREQFSNNFHSKNYKFNVIDTREVLLNNQKVAQRVALWEKKLKEERTCEIFQKIQEERMETAKEAEEDEMKQEQFWREQERKAKEAEEKMRAIARKAREQHKRNSMSPVDLETFASCGGTESNPSSETAVAMMPAVPPNRQAVLHWYVNVEYPRKAGIKMDTDTMTARNDAVHPWFHGLITRIEAENILNEQTDGSFLIRLSERIWGYALSYKAVDKCKHYLINSSRQPNKSSYRFLGKNHVEHKSLEDLIAYHHVHPLTEGEKLVQVCPRSTEDAINELMSVARSKNSQTA